jgi:hypothetical protein
MKHKKKRAKNSHSRRYKYKHAPHPENSMKAQSNWAIIVIVIVVLLAVGGMLLIFLRSPEDSWIKNDRGFYVKQGNPSYTPPEVAQQQELIQKAQTEFNRFKLTTSQTLSSQCIGTVYLGDAGYAIDLVHIPRTDEDNRPENQCQAYREGTVKHFIELDNDGNVVRIA